MNDPKDPNHPAPHPEPGRDNPRPADSPAELLGGHAGGSRKPGGSEVLSQSEVERLVSQVQGESELVEVIAAGGKRIHVKPDDIQPCDFRQPSFLTSGELRRIRIRHEEFIRSLEAQLSIYLRLEVGVRMAKLQTLGYQAFANGLASSTHLTLFKLDPLKGICLVEIPPRLGRTIVDRMLGGPGQAPELTGEPSEIELFLLDHLVLIMLREWSKLWAATELGVPVILGHETSSRFLNSSPQDAIMLALSMEVQVGDCVEQIQLAFPYLTIEPLVHRSDSVPNGNGVAPLASGGPSPNHLNLDSVNIRVNAKWNELQVTMQQLAQMKTGDVFMLDAKCFEQVHVDLEHRPKFAGRLGTSDGHFAVELKSQLAA